MKEDEAIKSIFESTKSVTGIDRSLISGPSRDRDCHFARMIVVYHLRDYGLRYEDISPLIGRSSNSGITYLLKAYHKERTPYFRGCANRVKKLLGNK